MLRAVTRSSTGLKFSGKADFELQSHCLEVVQANICREGKEIIRDRQFGLAPRVSSPPLGIGAFQVKKSASLADRDRATASNLMVRTRKLALALVSSQTRPKGLEPFGDGSECTVQS